MDNKIFILFAFFLLFGCSNNHIIENETYEILEIDNYNDKPEEGYMRVCSIDKSPTYTYVVYQGNAYQRVDNEQEIISQTIVSKTQLCTKEKNNDWECFDLTPGDYISYYDSIAQNTKYPTNQALSLECVDIPYEEGIFEI